MNYTSSCLKWAGFFKVTTPSLCWVMATAWVRPRQDDPTLATVYQLHDDRLHAAKESLREYENKDDAAAYTVTLEEVLKLAGEGMQEPLTHHGGLPRRN